MPRQRTRHVGRLFVAVLLFLAPCGLSRAEEAPLAALTAVARHLDAGVAAFLAGKPPAEAFAPWKVEGTDEETSLLREDLQEAGVAFAKSFHLAFEVHYVKVDEVVYCLRGAIWATPESVSLLQLEGEPLDAEAVPERVFDFEVASAALTPFAAAIKSLDASVREHGGNGVPLADVERVNATFGEVMPMDRAKASQDRIRTLLATAGPQIAALAPDRAVARIDGQGFLALDAAGKVLGVIRGALAPRPDGSLAYRLRDFRAYSAKEARIALARQMAEALAQAVSMYYAIHRRFPPTLEDLVTPEPKTGEPLLDAIPKDPWGQPYRYAIRDAKTFVITSCGEDLKEGTPDDLTWPK